MRRDLSTIDRDIGQDWSRIIQEAFAHGITNDMIYGGLVTGQTALQALNVAQIIQNCLVPTRRVTWEGRVFKYARAATVVGHTAFGLKFWDELGDGVAYNTTVQTQDAGDSIIRITTGGAESFAKDELVGGYLILHATSIHHQMTRRITANTAADVGSAMTITVDVPWPIDIELAYDVEILRSPYMFLRQRAAAGDDPQAGCHYSSVAGMPQVKSTVVNSFHWIQTWGPMWVNPLTPVGDTQTADRRTLFFDYEGQLTLNGGAIATAMLQIAGFIINAEQTAVGPPLVMLQISP